jgi:transcriptional regulator with XRE-family HTH domain
MENFGEWLKQQMDTARISQKELAQKSGVTPAQISRIIGGTRGVGTDALTGIARALKLPRELVFEKAGLLPPKTELTAPQRAVLYLLKDLPDSDAEMVLALLEQRAEYYTKHPEARPRPSDK